MKKYGIMLSFKKVYTIIHAEWSNYIKNLNKIIGKRCTQNAEVMRNFNFLICILQWIHIIYLLKYHFLEKAIEKFIRDFMANNKGKQMW